MDNQTVPSAPTDVPGRLDELEEGIDALWAQIRLMRAALGASAGAFLSVTGPSALDDGQDA